MVQNSDKYIIIIDKVRDTTMAEPSTVKACRLCLAMDRKLFKIEFSLESSMKSILGQNIAYTSWLPKYVCFECAALVKKFQTFRKTCLVAQTVLYNIMKNNNEITEQELKNVDRKDLKLESCLTCSKLQLEQYREQISRNGTEEILLKERLDAEDDAMQHLDPVDSDLVYEDIIMKYEEEVLADDFDVEETDVLENAVSLDEDNLLLAKVTNNKNKRRKYTRKGSVSKADKEVKKRVRKRKPIETLDSDRISLEADPLLEDFEPTNITDTVPKMDGTKEKRKQYTEECILKAVKAVQNENYSRDQDKASSSSYKIFRQKANARKRRFLDKMTPEQKKLKKKKDLEYYYRKKAQKKNSISKLPSAEQARVRELWRKNSKTYREKKKNKQINN